MKGRAPESRRPPRRSGSLRLGRVAGIEVRLHWTFLVLVFLVAWASSASGLASVAFGLAWIGGVFGSVLVHEVAHGIVARHRGVRVNDILLTPLGGLSRLADVPRRPEDELAIALVGPLTSLALALLLALAGLAVGASLWPPTLGSGAWVARLAWLNVLLGGFNLLPALPMDGGRVLRAALERRRGHEAATRLAAGVARVLAVAMILVGLAVDIWLVLIGAFVLLGAGAEEQEASGPGPGHGTQGHGTQGHGTQGHGTQGHGTQGQGEAGAGEAGDPEVHVDAWRGRR